MAAQTSRLCLVAVLLSVYFRMSFSSETKRDTALRDKMFFLQQTDDGENRSESKLLVVTWQADGKGGVGGCEIFDDQNLIEEVLSSTSNPEIQHSSGEDIKDLLKDCSEVTMRRKRQIVEYSSTSTNMPHTIRRSTEGNRDRSTSTIQPRRQNSKETKTQSTTDSETTIAQQFEGPKKPQTTTTEGYDGLPVIWPGTKWCGAGDIAKNYDDLGLHVDTDKCCRSHDLCNDTLAPGETRNNLTNGSPFTKLSCKCDNDFYDCLSRVNSVISNGIGNLYFNVLKRECYELDYPLTSKCKRYRSLLKLTCKEYERNKKAPKVNQWVSAKKYKKLPFPGPITITLPF